MAVFVVEPGERELFRERVSLVRDSWADCELVVTDRRLVMTSIDTKPGPTQGLLFFGALGGLLSGLLKGTTQQKRATHQIRRDNFGDVFVIDKCSLRVESTGEGYAKQWVDIKTKDPQQLADRIHRWAAEQLDAAALPVATVKRD